MRAKQVRDVVCSKVGLTITMMDYYSNIRSLRYQNVKRQMDAGIGDDKMIIFQAFNRTETNETTGVRTDKTKEFYRFESIGENGENGVIEDVGGEGQYLIKFAAAASHVGKVEFHLLLCGRAFDRATAARTQRSDAANVARN